MLCLCLLPACGDSNGDEPDNPNPINPDKEVADPAGTVRAYPALVDRRVVEVRSVREVLTVSDERLLEVTSQPSMDALLASLLLGVLGQWWWVAGMWAVGDYDWSPP